MLPMTTSAQLQGCENEVAQIRLNIADLQSTREGLLRRIEGHRRAIREIESRGDIPAFRVRILEIEHGIQAIQEELQKSAPQLEHFRQALHRTEEKCWELRRQRGRNPPTEDELRKTIDDPRYWRDGDLALTHFVSDGFKRLYPDKSED
jgi:chromosome segregation ATPase